MGQVQSSTSAKPIQELPLEASQRRSQSPIRAALKAFQEYTKYSWQRLKSWCSEAEDLFESLGCDPGEWEQVESMATGVVEGNPDGSQDKRKEFSKIEKREEQPWYVQADLFPS